MFSVTQLPEAKVGIARTNGRQNDKVWNGTGSTVLSVKGPDERAQAENHTRGLFYYHDVINKEIFFPGQTMSVQIYMKILGRLPSRDPLL